MPRRPGSVWTEASRSTTYPEHNEVAHAIGEHAINSGRPAFIYNTAEFGRKWLVYLTVPVFVVWIVSCFSAVGPQMHSSCFLHMRSEPYVAGPAGGAGPAGLVDLCFGLHGYYDRAANATVSQTGYDIIAVARNATGYPGLDGRWGPVTRGFAVTPLFTAGLFVYMCAVVCGLTGFAVAAHACLMAVSLVAVSVNLAVFVGVRGTLIQQAAAHAGSGTLPGVKVSPVGALAWLQLLTMGVFWVAGLWTCDVDVNMNVFEQPTIELEAPPRSRRFPRTADNHAFPYYFHSGAGMDVTRPVTPPSSIYRPPGSVAPRDAAWD